MGTGTNVLLLGTRTFEISELSIVNSGSTRSANRLLGMVVRELSITLPGIPQLSSTYEYVF